MKQSLLGHSPDGHAIHAEEFRRALLRDQGTSVVVGIACSLFHLPGNQSLHQIPLPAR
ncbi:MAG: hypothetical protein WAZ94_02090 [Phycisphaerales bacterium]